MLGLDLTSLLVGALFASMIWETGLRILLWRYSKRPKKQKKYMIVEVDD